MGLPNKAGYDIEIEQKVIYIRNKIASYGGTKIKQ